MFGDNTREVANCYFLIGINYFKDLKHFHKAKFSFLKSLMIMQGYLNDKNQINDDIYVKDSIRLAEIYYNLALLYKSNYKFEKAIDNFKLA